MGFITCLPKSEGCGSNMVVIDQFSQYVTFVAALANSTTEDVVLLFLENMEKYWGLELHFSTSFHLQTDVQTKRVNIIFLEALVSANQTDLAKLLDMAQFSYNNVQRTEVENHKAIEIATGLQPLTPLLLAGNLLGLYAEWHSHLLPYYSFNQFVHKLEQVGGTKRVKACSSGVPEYCSFSDKPQRTGNVVSTMMAAEPLDVYNTVDGLLCNGVTGAIGNGQRLLTFPKVDDSRNLAATPGALFMVPLYVLSSSISLLGLRQRSVVCVTCLSLDTSDTSLFDAAEAMNLDEPNSFQEDCDPPEVMLDEVYDKATEEPSQGQALWDEVNAAEVSSLSSKEVRNQVPDNTACSSAETQISEEQRVHIEANRLRALVRAAARARSFMSA
ncbi:hypothetical protein RJ640_007085 [Escallonia rubra]|uniref:Chromosome segregation in meiosis protein 3 domain-containing protein n=1 Tax=Escallonia rubra TaxID=112253 RepID=A0AA88R0T1_9ASTE|nr:hypothetical protein RJ640_007085 [Escallonia rubra]